MRGLPEQRDWQTGVSRTTWLIVLAVLVVVFLWAFYERRSLVMHAFALAGTGAPPPLNEPPREGPDTRWFDDYFTVELVAPDTWAIGEPRYPQQNYSYLIIGAEKALLFDAGPGVRDIRATAESLTAKPIVFLPSHFHYDHVGNEVTFDEIAVVDLPYIRQRAKGDLLTLRPMEHLGAMEGFEAPTWQVDHWWPPDTRIELGDRMLTLVYTPGHTTDSISLYDPRNRILFSGDYLHPGTVFGFLPNSRMGDFFETAERLLTTLGDDISLLAAHRVTPPGPPRLDYEDLRDFRTALVGIRDGKVEGSGGYPSSFAVNERVSLIAEPRWLQRW